MQYFKQFCNKINNFDGFRIIYFFNYFLCMMQVTIIYTHNLFHGIYSANLTGYLLHCIIMDLFMLSSVIIGDFLMDGFSEARTVKITECFFFCRIHFRMKKINMIPCHYVYLKFLHNNNWILAYYKIKVSIPSSMKKLYLYIIYSNLAIRLGYLR